MVLDFTLLKLFVFSWKVKESTTALANNNRDEGESEREEHAGKLFLNISKKWIVFKFLSSHFRFLGT